MKHLVLALAVLMTGCVSAPVESTCAAMEEAMDATGDGTCMEPAVQEWNHIRALICDGDAFAACWALGHRLEEAIWCVGEIDAAGRIIDAYDAYLDLEENERCMR